MSIAPDGCQELKCIDDINAICPDKRMKQCVSGHFVHREAAARQADIAVPAQSRFDSDGKVIGCLSACMAGINAQEPSMNCCVSSRGFSGRRIRTDSRSIANELHAAQSGKYSPIPKCVPSGVDYYSVFKPICPSAYWYREAPVLPSFRSFLF